jgi:hypothetical protein
MPINYNQQDSAFRPLNGFLFRCEFHVVGNSNITKDILKKLEYSVSTVKLPKMKEMEAEPHSFGSFFIPFPFFSTGEKDMMIEFYETDDMLISKVFYSFLNRYRWKSSTMFDKEQADLGVTVTIYDQRNLYGSSNRPLYRNIYWLKTTDLEPPQFTRSGSDVDLSKVTVTFNTIESDYKNAIDSREFGNTNEINVGAKDDPAFGNTDELGDKIAEMFAGLMNDNSQTGGNTSGLPDRVSSSKKRREYAESLGVDSKERLAVLKDHPDKLKELRKFLESEGVDIHDYSEVSDALVEMGIFGNVPQHICQKGVSVLESLVSGEKRVSAPSASRSVDKWVEAGFEVTEEKAFTKKIDIDNYIMKLANEGKLEEGQKIIIDYDKTGKSYGHIVTVLYNKERGWYTSSDGRQGTMTGLSVNHKVVGIKILKKSADKKLLEESGNLSGIGKE